MWADLIEFNHFGLHFSAVLANPAAPAFGAGKPSLPALVQAKVRGWQFVLPLQNAMESGVLTESGFRKVCDEIGPQSVELAEQRVFTTAERSSLPERRIAYEKLVNRTVLDTVKPVIQALIQAERFGTPVANALRVLSAESCKHRFIKPEKKANGGVLGDKAETNANP